jgi:hypothetical protein
MKNKTTTKPAQKPGEESNPDMVGEHALIHKNPVRVET